MTTEMRQELNGVKMEVHALGVQMGDMKQELNGVKQELNGVKAEVGSLGVQMTAVKQELNAVKTETGSRLDRLETITRTTAIVVAGHTEAFVRIEKRLTKLDELDGIKKSLEIFTSEIIASRHERTLMGKSFSNQQVTLSDHELRLTRIELRDKQS